MKISKYLIAIFLFSNSVFAINTGEGSEFVLNTEGQKVGLSIYISEVKGKDLGVEFHFGAGGILSSNMWQQFEMNVDKKQGIQIQSGFIKTSLSSKPERMLREHFYQNRGVQVQDFLFTKDEEIAKNFIAEEVVEIPAGSIIAKHYRKSHDGQTVDFWISERVKPIGLVKLVSKSTSKKTNNYSIELSSLLKNVKPAINPAEAIPMTKKTKKLLSRAKAQ
jgi:hypothetical protein